MAAHYGSSRCGIQEKKYSRKVIISCAITGSVHTPSMSPYLPITPDEIAESAIGAAEAGASILHMHARDPIDGHPVGDPDLFRQFLSKVKKNSDAVLNITTGGGMNMSVEERFAGAMELEPEICSFDVGSTNFSLVPAMRARIGDRWKYAWEKPYLEMTHRNVYNMPFTDLERLLPQLNPKGICYEHEVFNSAHLSYIEYLWKKNLLKPPFWVQGVFGVLGSWESEWENIGFLKQRMDTLFGNQYEFSVLGAGGGSFRNGITAALMGGHVRVGLEDSLFIDKGVLAKSNAEIVVHIRKLLEGLGYEIATPADVREMLKLKGPDTVKF